MLTFEGVVFALALAKTVQHIREHQACPPRLLGVLLRDSMVYFGGMFAIILTNLLIWITARVCGIAACRRLGTVAY